MLLDPGSPKNAVKTVGRFWINDEEIVDKIRASGNSREESTPEVPIEPGKCYDFCLSACTMYKTRHRLYLRLQALERI